MARLSPTAQAGIWMIGAIFSFSSMAVAGRVVSHELNTFELLLYRSLIGILIVVVAAKFAGTLNQIAPRHMGLHLIRNIGHFSGQSLWYFAITVIPLAQVFALEFTSPLWVLVLSPFLLGERLTPVRALIGLLGFIGILIVARPGVETLSWGLAAAALSAIGFACTAIYTKKLTRHVSLTGILFWLVALQSIMALICTGYDGEIRLPSVSIYPWLLLIAFGGLIAHFCITKALSIAPASTVMPFDFARVPLIAVVGMLFYSEPLDGFVIFGAILIFIANYLNIKTSAPTPSVK